ncbi:MAG: hypothetical protein CMI54_02940 [Parcubacteria group bacterium]|nr:hypothetical protein [Parcubacteria group bacterium]|tara:strand:- start:18230 stop:18688 length:459 start_codon:yes stop_codon:yes gene_type:complete
MVNGKRVGPHKNILKWKTKIAWLAGIIDGEGSIIVTEGKRNGRHLCRILFVNTDVGILSAAKQILSDLEIFYIGQLKPSSGNRKDCWTVEVNRQIEVRRLGRLLLLYLQSGAKREKLSLALRLIDETQKTAEGKRSNLRRQLGKKRLVVEVN